MNRSIISFINLTARLVFVEVVVLIRQRFLFAQINFANLPRRCLGAEIECGGCFYLLKPVEGISFPGWRHHFVDSRAIWFVYGRLGFIFCTRYQLLIRLVSLTPQILPSIKPYLSLIFCILYFGLLFLLKFNILLQITIFINKRLTTVKSFLKFYLNIAEICIALAGGCILLILQSKAINC